MPTIVRTANAHDFLALVPHLAGFQPRDSLVLVAFRGTRTASAMRFDLPTAIGRIEHRRIATSMVGIFTKVPDVDGVVPVIYTDGRIRRSVPYESFVREIVRRADFSGFVVHDALCVAANGWASYFDPDYPTGGHPLDLIVSSAVVGSTGVEPVGGLLDGTDLPVIPLDRSERVARRLLSMKADIDAGRVDRLETRFPPSADFPLMMEQTLSADPDALSEEDIALLILVLQPPSYRDSVMLLWAFDLTTGDQSFALNERFHAGEDVTNDPVGALMLGEGRRPDPERVRRAIRLLTVIVAHAPRSTRPPMFCMLAWMNWAMGRASAAGLFVERAIEIDRGYGMAALVGTMLRNGMLPEWAFEPAYGEQARPDPLDHPSHLTGSPDPETFTGP